MEVPQKIKNRTTIWPINSISGYLFEETQNICTPGYTCSLQHFCTIAEMWKQPKVHQQMNRYRNCGTDIL